MICGCFSDRMVCHCSLPVSVCSGLHSSLYRWLLSSSLPGGTVCPDGSYYCRHDIVSSLLQRSSVLVPVFWRRLRKPGFCFPRFCCHRCSRFSKIAPPFKIHVIQHLLKNCIYSLKFVIILDHLITGFCTSRS